MHDVDAIQYRHEVMQDLERRTLFEKIEEFARRMRTMREHFKQAEKLYYKLQKQRWFLDAVTVYCSAVRRLAEDLAAENPQSRGFGALRAHLDAYVAGEPFQVLAGELHELLSGLAGVRYAFVIKGQTVSVRKYEEETDYSAEVLRTFERFKQGAVKEYLAEFREPVDMNHVEAQVLELVARLYSDLFGRIESYCTRHVDFIDKVLGVFDREVQFYIGYIDFMRSLQRRGLRFCYPVVSADSKAVSSREGFDVALARKLAGEEANVVCNDFSMQGVERVFVVSGPNQGGKTTFARAFGQLHYLASVGCPVPGREAHLYLFDQLLTHFEQEENLTNLRGKLEDELVRIHEILEAATPRSIVIMNEIFTSTTLQDAVFLGERVMQRILDLDLLCVCVTFIDELAALSDKIVSMVSTVTPENPSMRTYKIVRRRADGLAYAISIAEKHRLTYEALKERLAIVKAFLMYPQRDFDVKQALPPNAEALVQDLELNTLFTAMAHGDKFLFEVARVAVLSGADADVRTILYRQGVLKDCLNHAALIRQIYDLAVDTIEREKHVWWGAFGRMPDTILHRSVEVLELFVGVLKTLAADRRRACCQASSRRASRRSSPCCSGSSTTCSLPRCSSTCAISSFATASWSARSSARATGGRTTCCGSRTASKATGSSRHWGRGRPPIPSVSRIGTTTVRGPSPSCGTGASTWWPTRPPSHATTSFRSSRCCAPSWPFT